MKKLILCSLVAISMAFGVDCNAMINRYANKPIMLVKSCTDNNNADACFCFAAVASVSAERLRQSGDYKEADGHNKAAIDFLRRACSLGNSEACAILDKAGVER